MFAMKQKLKSGRMAGIIVLTLWAGWLLTVSSATAGEARVGVINIHKAITETKEFQKAQVRFRKEIQKEKAIIEDRKKKLENMVQEINKQGFVLSPELKKQKEDSFLREKKDFERYLQDQEEQFARKEKMLLDKLSKKMLEVLKQLGKQKKLSMITEMKSLYYSDSALDLTSLATKTYDRLYPQ